MQNICVAITFLQKLRQLHPIVAIEINKLTMARNFSLQSLGLSKSLRALLSFTWEAKLETSALKISKRWMGATFFLNGHSRPFFFIFVFSGSQLTDKYVRCISLPMSGFKPRISGVGSDRSANCPATRALGWGKHITMINMQASRLSCPRSDSYHSWIFFRGKVCRCSWCKSTALVRGKRTVASNPSSSCLWQAFNLKLNLKKNLILRFFIVM